MTAPAPEADPGRFSRPLEDGRVECRVCPRACRLNEGQRGFCFVRACQQGRVVLTSYGRSSGFCVDPIEKKPLNHFLPGTPVFSFGTAGCNLGCKFCQNHDISKSRDLDTLASSATPEAIASTARRLGCRSVAFTYNDPVIFLEYAVDTARECHALGLRTVAVTAGYVNPGAREALFSAMDAANIDLKGFTESFYEKVCVARLADVLETLRYVHSETPVWLEVTTLLIPGLNDSPDEIARAADWFVENLGPDTPWHFSAFHPDFRMLDVPPTPPSTLLRAREIARQRGIRHVYTGNIRDLEGATTCCPSCSQPVIVRDGYSITRWAMDTHGGCSACGSRIAGIFEASPGSWGNRRMPVHM